jgi:hypothetical protein
MPSYTVIIDKASIEAKILAALPKAGQAEAYKQAERLFRRAKNAMMQDFDKHPITAEIKAGNRAINFSNTLDGYGNLFSFLGFEDGSNPVGPLRDLLELGTNFRYTGFRRQEWRFKVQTPSKEAIETVTPMEWEVGNSWATAVEEGVSNLSYYLYKKTSTSRSGTGLQAGWEINEDLVFQKTKYLTEIFKNFRERINK